MSTASPPIDYNVPGGAGDTGWIVNGADTLVVTGASSQTGEVLTVSLRFVQSDRVIVDQFTLSLAAGDRTVQTGTYNFQALFDNFYSGSYAQQIYLTDVSIVALKAITRGQTFARVNLNRVGAGLSGAQVVARCAILSDYVTKNVTACLRNSRHFTSIEGPGANLVYAPAPVGPGVDWTITQPINTRWRIQSLFCTFTTSVNPGNRLPVFNFSQGGNGVFQTIPTAFLVAGAVYQMMLGPTLAHAGPLTGGTFFSMPLPSDYLLGIAGGNQAIVAAFTNGLDAADQWGFILLCVEEWLDNV